MLQRVAFRRNGESDITSELRLKYVNKDEDDGAGMGGFAFNVSNIPFFCGALQLHDFSRGLRFRWDEFDVEEFMDAVIEQVHRVYDLAPGMRLVWWDREGGNGQELAEALGAEKVMHFTNPNSDNEVMMYSLEVPEHPTITRDEDDFDDIDF